MNNDVTGPFFQPFVSIGMQRRPKWLIPPKMVHKTTACRLLFYQLTVVYICVSCPSQFEMMKSKQRPFDNKGEDILPFEKMKEQRMQERMERVRRAAEMRR